jgi:hypothetical protein
VDFFLAILEKFNFIRIALLISWNSNFVRTTFLFFQKERYNPYGRGCLIAVDRQQNDGKHETCYAGCASLVCRSKSTRFTFYDSKNSHFPVFCSTYRTDMWYKLRPNKKICVVLVTRPTLIFTPDPKLFFQYSKINYQYLPYFACILSKKIFQKWRIFLYKILWYSRYS